jgi:hypothetical protein
VKLGWRFETALELSDEASVVADQFPIVGNEELLDIRFAIRLQITEPNVAMTAQNSAGLAVGDDDGNFATDRNEVSELFCFRPGAID